MRSKGNVCFRGIDVSNHQGNIDFSAVKNTGIQIVYMKASESNFYRDKYLDQNYANAKAQGLRVGFYHFFRCNVDAVEQARYFVNCIKGKESDCKLCIDIETTEGRDANAVTNMCIAFLEEVKRLTGKDVVVYTYTSFAKSNLTSAIGKYSLWIADYKGENALPNDNPIWSSWSGYQYASDGRVNGVNGDCDVDLFTNDILLEDKKFKITMSANIQDIGLTSTSGINSCKIGTEGQSKRLEMFSMTIDGIEFTYNVHEQDVGDTQTVEEGQVLGSINMGKRVEGITINVAKILTGYQLQYRCHIENIGTTNWCTSGQFCGTRGKSLRVEEIEVAIVRC